MLRKLILLGGAMWLGKQFLDAMNAASDRMAQDDIEQPLNPVLTPDLAHQLMGEPTGVDTPSGRS